MCKQLSEKIRKFFDERNLAFWIYAFAIVFFVVLFKIYVVNLKPEESLLRLLALPILIGLSCLGCSVYKLKKDGGGKELYYLLGFIVLLFTTIYCVSILRFNIQGFKQEKEEFEKKINKATESSVNKVEKTAEILSLSARVNWQANGGDYNSYKTLLSLQNEIKNEDLNNFIIAKINAIKNIYDVDTIRKVADSLLYICQYSVPPCAKGIEPVEGFNAKNIYEHLTESYKLWPEHARAASLIRNRETSPNKNDVSLSDINKELVRLMKDENEKLLVRKLAFEAYKDLNPSSPKSEGIFDFNSVIKHFEEKDSNP